MIIPSFRLLVIFPGFSLKIFCLGAAGRRCAGNWGITMLMHLFHDSGLFTSILRFAGYFLHNPISDNTWAGVYLYIYVVCESCMYLIAACLLTYKPLGRVFRKDGPLSVSGKKFRGLLGSWKSSSQRGGSKLSWRSSSMKKGSSSGGEGSDDDGVRLREVSTGSEGFSRPLEGVISTGGRDSDGDGKVSPV